MTRKFPEMVLLPIGSRSDQENRNSEFWIACYEFVARIQIRIPAIAAVDKALVPQGTREKLTLWMKDGFPQLRKLFLN